MKTLQLFIPNCNKADKASMLDDAIEYLKTLQLHVQVKDTGCGVSPQDISHVFTKFAHTQSGGNGGYSGTGLGHAICKRFVTLMEGHIWLEIDSLGKGCTASFVHSETQVL